MLVVVLLLRLVVVGGGRSGGEFAWGCTRGVVDGGRGQLERQVERGDLVHAVLGLEIC